jgi:hypothetical protein
VKVYASNSGELTSGGGILRYVVVADWAIALWIKRNAMNTEGLILEGCMN